MNAEFTVCVGFWPEAPPRLFDGREGQPASAAPTTSSHAARAVPASRRGRPPKDSSLPCMTDARALRLRTTACGRLNDIVEVQPLKETAHRARVAKARYLPEFERIVASARITG